MRVTVEISIYPLTERYEQVVIDFIQRLKKNTDIAIDTNGLSTLIFGDYDAVTSLLQHEIKNLWETEKAVVIMKMGKGELKFKS